MNAKVSEEERQMILLALAELSLRRPGWLDTLGRVADKFHGCEMFDKFRETSADLISKIEINMGKSIPYCCGQPCIGVRAEGIDHYEAKRYYIRCNKCHKSSSIHSSLDDAMQAWRKEHGG